MAATSARYNTRPKRKEVSPERDRSNIPLWAHPEYKYYFDEWKIIRDCCEGEKDIKGEKETYLPRLEGMELSEYKVYLQLACFYNFTGRTAGALVGTLLKKRPVVSGLPKELANALQTITQDSGTWDSFVERQTDDYVKMRRYGVLVDLPAVAAAVPKPFIAEYVTEDILDWAEEVDPATGRKRLTRVVLREWKEVRDANVTAVYKVQRFRVLTLENGVYRVAVHSEPTADTTLNTVPVVTTPTFRGNALDFIPFKIVGGAACIKAGLNDIARLNLSHYTSYAILEHARFYTGLPIYYAETDGEGAPEYVLAPNRVWEVQKGCKAGIVEFNGQGLKFLENALEQKEAQAAALGGRLIGVTTRSVSESDNQSQMKDRNEQSILLQNARALEEACTFVLRIWAFLSAVPKAEADKIDVEYNKDFLYSTIGSREFRAIQAMYTAGALPVDVLYDYMLKAEVIPEAMTLDEFKVLLKTASSFPNQPDFEARRLGYANAQSRTQAELKEGDQQIAEEEAEIARKAADAARRAAAKAPPSPPGSPPGNFNQ